jgi:hypothetical protein
MGETVKKSNILARPNGWPTEAESASDRLSASAWLRISVTANFKTNKEYKLPARKG